MSSAAPTTLAEYHGQRRAVGQVEVALAAYRRERTAGRPHAFPHLGLWGQQGLGKTQLVNVVASELSVPLVEALGCSLAQPQAVMWHRVVPRDGGLGQVTVLGKGSKTRSILLPATVYAALSRLRPPAADNDAPVFRSRLGRAMSTGQMLRVVKTAASRAGISRRVVMHTLRHCHCSHALDRGAPISLVSASAGHASVATTGRYLHARPNDSSGRFLALG